MSIFLCLTKCDTLFDVKAGADADNAIANRMSNNLMNFPGWTKEWSPGAPFRNCHVLRNPKFQREEVHG